MSKKTSKKPVSQKKVQNMPLLFGLYGVLFVFLGFLIDQIFMSLVMSGKTMGDVSLFTYYSTGVFPGLFFGLAVFFALKYFNKTVKGILSFVVIAALGSLIDFSLQDAFFRTGLFPTDLHRVIANLVGVYTMLFGFHTYIKAMSPKAYILSGLFGAALLYLPFLLPLPNSPFVPLTSLIYPAGMAALLGWFLS